MLALSKQRIALSLLLLGPVSCADSTRNEAAQLEEFSRVCENPNFLIWPDNNLEIRRIDVAACAGGGVSRFKDHACERRKPGNCPTEGPTGACRSDSDCTERPRGHCSLVASHDPSQRTCDCYYPECSDHADCGEGAFCSCADVRGGTCIQSNCMVWSDCESGRCDRASYHPMVNCGVALMTQYACRTPLDTCFRDEDCKGKFFVYPVCAPNLASGRWECKERPVCG